MNFPPTLIKQNNVVTYEPIEFEYKLKFKTLGKSLIILEESMNNILQSNKEQSEVHNMY